MRKLLNPAVAALFRVVLAMPLVLAPVLFVPAPAQAEVDVPVTPDVASPDVASPDVASPDVASPDVASPDVAKPDVAARTQAEILDDLFAELADPGTQDWQRVEQDIWREWSKSGSASADLLLMRGREAMELGDFDTAIQHLTALTDHAPDFAEGWNARATAYYNAGKFGPSIEDVAHTLALNPRHFGALSGLAMMLEELEQPDRALRAYEAARAIHPHQPGVLEAIERLHAQLDGQSL